MAQQDKNRGSEIIDKVLPAFKVDSSSRRVLEPFTRDEFERRVGDESETGTHYAMRIFESYRRTLETALALPYEEVLKLDKIFTESDLLRESNTTNVKLTAPKILRILHETGGIDEARKAVRKNQDEEEVVLAFLTEVVMMFRASTLVAEKGVPASDADHDFDNSLYGHTFQKMEPRAQVHFVLAHFWGRISRIAADDKLALARSEFGPKDTFWSLVSLGISLQIAKGTADPELVEKWSTNRPHGVKWHMNRLEGEQGYAIWRQREINSYVAGSTDRERGERIENIFENVLRRGKKKYSAESEKNDVPESKYTADLSGFHATFRGRRIQNMAVTTTEKQQFVELIIDSDVPQLVDEPMSFKFSLTETPRDGVIIRVDNSSGIETDMPRLVFLLNYVPSLTRAVSHAYGQRAMFSANLRTDSEDPRIAAMYRQQDFMANLIKNNLTIGYFS